MSNAPTGIRDRLAAAQKAAVDSTGLKKDPKTTAAAAPVSSPVTSSELTTGMQSSASLRPKVIGIERLPTPSEVKPKRKSEADVIFKSLRPSLAFFLPVSDQRVSFKNTWFMTSDPKLIEFMRKPENQKHYHYKEDKEEATK